MKTKWILTLAALPFLATALVAQATDQPKQENVSNDAHAHAICSRTLLTNYDPQKGEAFGHETPIWRIDNSSVAMFQSGMTVDADGAPNAYNPDNTGLDDLANAGTTEHWDGILADYHNMPFVQDDDDPFPGFYISTTALYDWTKKSNDTARYVDASQIPYIVLPEDVAEKTGARLGDFAVVTNLRSGKSVYAIFADLGTLGEGSVALADKLDLSSDARSGGTHTGILYVIYPGSGSQNPESIEVINTQTEKIFREWGGEEKLKSCAAAQPQKEDQLAAKNLN
jgi:hypothetical protein